jgi:hypothetical protein
MKKEMADVNANDFVIFKAGTWNGETFTEADLDNMVKSYNADEPPHIIAGHSSDYKGKTLIPSFGRVLGGLKRVGKELIAQGAVFNDKMAEWIKEGFYNQRSVELTKDNKKILAIGMLGATPPAVKGMSVMQEALKESALAFSEFTESKVIEFADASPINLDEVEILAVKDTLEDITEEVANFLKNLEYCLNDEDCEDEKLFKLVWDLQASLCSDLQLHSSFIKKIELIEESMETTEEMSDKKGWKEFKEKIKQMFNNKKESEMDAKKEKEYQQKIADLEAKNKEFADKELALQLDADKKIADAKLAEQTAKDETIKTDIKTFCDTAIKEGRMTPAMRGTDEKPGDEEIMFTLAKTSPEALKSFQEKYSAKVIPLGEVALGNENENDKSPQVIQQAKEYAKAHANDKEFAGLTLADATNRALYLHSQAKIKFVDKK